MSRAHRNISRTILLDTVLAALAIITVAAMVALL
jgi:dolichyl-phosphate-mannose--protein O-mannosyl transferase